MDLDQIKGNKPGTSYTERKVESLGDVVELLLERKNRVWARIFIHSLSGCLDTSPMLHDWAHKLDSSGQYTLHFLLVTRPSTCVLKSNANLPAAYLCTLATRLLVLIKYSAATQIGMALCAVLANFPFPPLMYSPGLNAAGLFIDRYADHLEQLDLAPLLHFAPLQDMLIEKFGTMPEFFSRLGLTITEYLKQAPPQEMRLFIWTLEEHRDQYASCHAALDYYFEIMGKRLDPHAPSLIGKRSP